jgi:hypothetical protein
MLKSLLCRVIFGVLAHLVNQSINTRAMAANSYLILSPAEPADIASAASSQRHTIPFVWAIALANPSTQFIEQDGLYYFATTVGDALAMLDRAQTAWNYNRYFRDTLAPAGIFRSWLAEYPSETKLYVNIAELILQSPSREADIAAMHTLGERVRSAIETIEQKDFSTFILDLRKLSYPFITIPITGDRQKDIEILRYEIRDTNDVEAEMALQLVGVDRDKSMLQKAARSIALREEASDSLSADETLTHEASSKVLTLFTRDLDEARHLLVHDLGCRVVQEGSNRVMMSGGGSDFLLVQVGESSDR